MRGFSNLDVEFALSSRWRNLKSFRRYVEIRRGQLGARESIKATINLKAFADHVQLRWSPFLCAVRTIGAYCLTKLAAWFRTRNRWL